MPPLVYHMAGRQAGWIRRSSTEDNRGKWLVLLLSPLAKFPFLPVYPGSESFVTGMEWPSWNPPEKNTCSPGRMRSLNLPRFWFLLCDMVLLVGMDPRGPGLYPAFPESQVVLKQSSKQCKKVMGKAGKVLWKAILQRRCMLQVSSEQSDGQKWGYPSANCPTWKSKASLGLLRAGIWVQNPCLGRASAAWLPSRVGLSFAQRGTQQARWLALWSLGLS